MAVKHETTFSDNWDSKFNSFAFTTVNTFVQTQRTQGYDAHIRRRVTNGADERQRALVKVKEIHLCDQTYSRDSRHCGHMAAGRVLRPVASEICVTQRAATQRPTKYSATGFQPPGAVEAWKLFPPKNPNNEISL